MLPDCLPFRHNETLNPLMCADYWPISIPFGTMQNYEKGKINSNLLLVNTLKSQSPALMPRRCHWISRVIETAFPKCYTVVGCNENSNKLNEYQRLFGSQVGIRNCAMSLSVRRTCAGKYARIWAGPWNRQREEQYHRVGWTGKKCSHIYGAEGYQKKNQLPQSGLTPFTKAHGSLWYFG